MAYLLKWDETGEHFYETGSKNGVIYPMKTDGSGWDTGYVWNGLRQVDEKPTGADETALWADDIKYLSLRAAEEFEATIQAYSFPEAFTKCDGTAIPTPGVAIGQQKRIPFCFSYITVLGNDALLDSYGEKLHILYNLTASPSERSYQSINDSPAAVEFSWDTKSVPVPYEGYKPVSCLTIESVLAGATTQEQTAYAAKYEMVKQYLFGTKAPATPSDQKDIPANVMLPADVVGVMAGTKTITFDTSTGTATISDVNAG